MHVLQNAAHCPFHQASDPEHIPHAESAFLHESAFIEFLHNGSHPDGGDVVQGAKPDSHFEHVAWHFPCHQEFEDEHICQSRSARLHSIALLLSWQVVSHLPGGGDVPGGGVVQGARPDSHFEHDALHCPCHQGCLPEHICQCESASAHSSVVLVSWQALSQVPKGSEVVAVIVMSLCTVVVPVVELMVDVIGSGNDVDCVIVDDGSGFGPDSDMVVLLVDDTVVDNGMVDGEDVDDGSGSGSGSDVVVLEDDTVVVTGVESEV